jgi:hypothetical protein
MKRLGPDREFIPIMRASTGRHLGDTVNVSLSFADSESRKQLILLNRKVQEFCGMS